MEATFWKDKYEKLWSRKRRLANATETKKWKKPKNNRITGNKCFAEKKY
jgi:hypothetical protein